jgi:hypothetical protein
MDGQMGKPADGQTDRCLYILFKFGQENFENKIKEIPNTKHAE